VGGACGHGFGGKAQGIERRIGSERMLSVDWIGLDLDSDRWQAGVNALMNLQVLAPRS
jgi:predicted GNAT superfamily acetyltransferase